MTSPEIAVPGNVVYIVGRHMATKWEFQGVFSTAALAEAACKESNWFVGPAVIDQELPLATHDWPGCYYPRADDN